MCESKEQLVAYVYDDLQAGERRRIEAHLSGCAECREELNELRTTRTYLALWAPPQPALGFRVIRGGSWLDAPEFQRSAKRIVFMPEGRRDFIGFRVALDAASVK